MLNWLTLSWWACLASDIKQPVFDKLDNHRPGQACGDFERAQKEARFEKFVSRLGTALFIDIDFFPSEGKQDYQRTNSGCGRDPGNRLLSKRSP